MERRIIITIIGFALISSLTGCKKFLQVPVRDDLAGTDFWKTKSDVESFTAGIYNKLRKATMQDALFFTATGDLRAAPTIADGNGDYNYIAMLRNNDLRAVMARNIVALNNITTWKNIYFAIGEANILYDQAGKLAGDVISDADATHYRAEAVFLRCLFYFLMVRVYGDVPYYTNAYNNVPLPRTDMLTVLKKCNDDLMAVKEDLPWTNTASQSIAVRASKGSIYALLMHINMWIAGFEVSDKETWYRKVADLGREMINNNNGAYQLLPLNRFKEVVHGRSKEGIFELVQNINAGETFATQAQYANFVLIRPYSFRTIPIIYYDLSFILKIYPSTEIDGRREAWFDENLYLNNGRQQMLKYASTEIQGDVATNQNDNMIVFRYADVILLTAEALAELNEDADAQAMVNLIRARAQATPFTSSGALLKSDIYYERVRELMGEGHYYYDLVRTKKILDGTFTSYPISADNFRQGAWTWPIDASALSNNPYMTLNQFWR